MTRARGAACLASLVLLAAGLRIAVIVGTGAAHAPAEENRIIARNLAAGRGFRFTEFGVTGPTAIRGPAYPMLLALVGPNRVGLILALNVIAGAATVPAAYVLAHRLASSAVAEPSRTIAPWIAAGVFAVWPTQLYAATLTQGLSVAVLLTLLALAFALRRTPPALLAGGALAGLASLTEPALALPLLLAAAVIGWRRQWPHAAVFVAAGLVVVAPWLYRNAIIFGGPMPLTSNGWRDVFLGNGPDVGGGQASLRLPFDDRVIGRGVTRLDGLDPQRRDRLKVAEPQRVAVFRDWSLQWLRENPAAYARLCSLRVVKASTFDWHIWQTAWDRGRPAATVLTAFAVCRLLAAAAFLGLLWRGRSVAHALLLAVAAGLVLTAAPTVVEMRSGVLMDVPQLMAVVLACRPSRAVGGAA